ncbi:MAG: antitoxin MazE-like protein [Candidatus Binatia bacterium]
MPVSSVQIWVPETTSPAFAKKLRRQVALLRGKPEERDAFDAIESIRDA